MDELELLKKDWQKQENVLPKLSYQEIYQMKLKKSSSMVRWIFVISILEFVFWASIDIIVRLTGKFDEIKVEGMETFTLIYAITMYSVLFFFIIKFYINYKKIKTTDSAKILMQNILKTRRTVKLYVWIYISVFAVFSFIMALYTMFYVNNSIDKQFPVITQVIIAALVVIIFVGGLALLYRLIYGVLTRRLEKNYKELEKLEL